MLSFNFNIRNPWSDYFKSGYVWSGNLFKNKFWELQAMRTHDVVCAQLEITQKQDHAGFRVELGLVSFNIAFTIYDNRHWNHIEGNWEK